MYLLSSIALLEVIKNKCYLRQSFKKVEKNGKVSIIHNNKIEYKYNRFKRPHTDIKIKNKIAVLFKSVRAAYNDYATQCGCDVVVPEKITSVRGLNTDLFKSFDVGQKFYYADINHAYFQVAYKMGMLPKKVYDKYKDNIEIKMYRNIALATVLAPKTIEYYNEGRYMTTITECNEIYNKIYTKIRITTYNIIGELTNLLGNRWISYNVDGICFTEDVLETVQAYFEKIDYSYKLLECEKLSETEFRQGDEVKKYYREIRPVSKIQEN